MRKVKYIRTSTLAQNSERQEINTQKFDKLYIDKCSGSLKLSERVQGKNLINDVKDGNLIELHLESIDRLGRDIIDILMTVELLNERKVNLFVENIGMYSLVNNKPNPSFKMIVSVLGNVAEMERKNMLERQRQGIEIAKSKGLYRGRPAGTSESETTFLKRYAKVVRELNNGESLRRTAALAGCSLGTVQKVSLAMKQQELDKNK